MINDIFIQNGRKTQNNKIEIRIIISEYNKL